MASQYITDKNTLKSWFQRGLKPLASQFAAWMDSYWHKDEKIPTASVEELETILNQKAETTEIISINKNLSEHIQDISEHKTEKEQSKLDHLADNPDLTYATKEELQAQGNVVITVDLRKATINEVKEDVVGQMQEYLSDGNHLSRTVFCLFQWFANPMNATGLNQCLVATDLELYGETEWQRTASLPEEVLTPWVINAGKKTFFFYQIIFYCDSDNSIVCELMTYKPQKVFKPFYLMINPNDTLYSEYFDKWKGQTRTLTLEASSQIINETKWEQFIDYYKQERDIPHVMMTSVMHYVSGRMQPYYPAKICRKGGFSVSAVTGFTFTFNSVIDYQGRQYVVEEIVEFPNFKGFGSTYNYTINYRPLRPLITVGPTPPENFEDGDIFIQTEE